MRSRPSRCIKQGHTRRSAGRHGLPRHGTGPATSSSWHWAGRWTALGRPRHGTGPATSSSWRWAGHVMALGRPLYGAGPATSWHWAGHVILSRACSVKKNAAPDEADVQRTGVASGGGCSAAGQSIVAAHKPTTRLSCIWIRRSGAGKRAASRRNMVHTWCNVPLQRYDSCNVLRQGCNTTSGC